MQCHPQPRDSAMEKSNTVLTMQTTRQQPAHPSSIQSTSLLLASCNLCHECRHHLHELIISTAVFDTLLLTPSTLFADLLLPLQLLPPTLLAFLFTLQVPMTLQLEQHDQHRLHKIWTRRRLVVLDLCP